MSFHGVPCVMTNTDQFYIRVCNCGVVHLSFGATVINVTSETAIAITETLREVSVSLRKRLEPKDHSPAVEALPEATQTMTNNVIPILRSQNAD